MLNGIPIYEKHISRFALASKIHSLEKNPMVLDCNFTVGQAFANFKLEVEDEEEVLAKLWGVLGMKPQFDLDTEINKLSYAQLDVFSLARACLVSFR